MLCDDFELNSFITLQVAGDVIAGSIFKIGFY
jgi:hypothetical protein